MNRRLAWLWVASVLASFGFGVGLATAVLETPLRDTLWRTWSGWQQRRSWQQALDNAPAPGAVGLTRGRMPSPDAGASTAGDRALLRQLGDAWTGERRQAAQAELWSPNFASIRAFHQSVTTNRDRLLGYLGPVYDRRRGRLLSRQPVTPDQSLCEEAGIEVSRVAVASRHPALQFEAFLLLPPPAQRNGHAVVALHGHDGSAASLVGLGPEDYSRQLGLRLACQGFAVLAPAVTADEALNNVASAQAALLGETLYGIMVANTLAAVDALGQATATWEPAPPIGLYGISNGGLLALMTAALADDVAFVGAEAILGDFWESTLLRARAQPNKKDYLYYFHGPMWLEFDLARLAYLIAPRPLLFTVGDFDSQVAGWESAWSEIEMLYDHLGAGHRADVILFHGGHELAEDAGIRRLQQLLAEPGAP